MNNTTYSSRFMNFTQLYDSILSWSTSLRMHSYSCSHCITNYGVPLFPLMSGGPQQWYSYRNPVRIIVTLRTTGPSLSLAAYVGFSRRLTAAVFDFVRQRVTLPFVAEMHALMMACNLIADRQGDTNKYLVCTDSLTASQGLRTYGPAKPLYASTTNSPSPSTFTWNWHYCVVDTESHGYIGERTCGPSSKERLFGDSRIHLLPVYRLVSGFRI